MGQKRVRQAGRVPPADAQALGAGDAVTVKKPETTALPKQSTRLRMISFRADEETVAAIYALEALVDDKIRKPRRSMAIRKALLEALARSKVGMTTV